MGVQRTILAGLVVSCDGRLRHRVGFEEEEVARLEGNPAGTQQVH